MNPLPVYGVQQTAVFVFSLNSKLISSKCIFKISNTYYTNCIPVEELKRDLHYVIFFGNNHICFDFEILYNPAVLGLLECCYIEETRNYLQWVGVNHIQLLLIRNQIFMILHCLHVYLNLLKLQYVQ